MEMLICPGKESKPRRESNLSLRDIPRDWWQVSYVARGVSKVKAYRCSGRAARKADDLYADGIPSKIEPCRTDVYIVDHVTGDFLLVASRMNPIEASRFSLDFAKSERSAGILLWPHGSPLSGLVGKVVDYSRMNNTNTARVL